MQNAASGNILKDIKQRRRRRRTANTVITVQPKSLDDIVAALTKHKQFPSPVRPMGSDSSVTRANATAHGTLLDMTALNRVLAMTANTVTVQAGIRLRDLAEFLAQEGMELVGGCANRNRTVGGAISSGTLAGMIPGDPGFLAASVEQMTLVTAAGKRLDVDAKLPDLLTLARMSYGLIGVIYAARLSIRPIRPYAIRRIKCDFDQFIGVLPNLNESSSAISASFMPFRDRIYVELRYPQGSEGRSLSLPWKLRDWAHNSAIPKVVKSFSKIMPLKNLRDPLIDSFTEATHVLLNNGLTSSGSNAAEQTGRFRKLVVDKDISGCVWLFPARDFGQTLRTFQKFCVRHYAESRFRCDLPAEAWRVNRDQRSLLSPSFAGPCFALNVRSTAGEGWDNFLLEYSEFAAHYSGVPVFNQTQCLKPGYAAGAYGKRMDRFRAVRQKLDPDDRLLNQYFAEQLA